MLNSLLLIFYLFLWGLFHSFLASFQVKKSFKNRFGEEINRYYRLAYNIFAVITFLPVFGLMLILKDYQLYLFQKPWIFVPLVFQFLSLVILAIGLRQTGALEFMGLHVFIVGNKHVHQRLNTRGLYKYVRHPLYCAGLLFLWSSPRMTINSLIVSISLTIYIIIGANFEERKLVNEFGDVYEEYQTKVPMLIPRLKWNKTD